MARPKAPPRVKLYTESLSADRVRYRVRLIEDGRLHDTTFWKQSEAAAYRSKLEDALKQRTGLTIDEALTAYHAEKLLHGTARRRTCDGQAPRLRRILHAYLDQRVHSITAERADAIYQQLVSAPTEKTGLPPAPASHRHYLKMTRAFFAWCVRKRYLQSNPFAEVRPVGRVRRGKPQLRAEEVSRYIAAGLKRYRERDDRLALAAVMLPIFGLRAGEALSRRIRDIDRGRTWRLHIDHGSDDSELLKTDNARRVLEIPSLLIPHLESLIAERDPGEYLFGASSRTGQRKSNQSLWTAVTSLCDEAGVPRVCPHAMRGFYASAGVQAGALPHVIAASMGHSSFAITAQHYVQPQAMIDAHGSRVRAQLDLDEKSDAFAQLSAEELIARLPPTTLQRIVELVTAKARSRSESHDGYAAASQRPPADAPAPGTRSLASAPRQARLRSAAPASPGSAPPPSSRRYSRYTGAGRR